MIVKAGRTRRGCSLARHSELTKESIKAGLNGTAAALAADNSVSHFHTATPHSVCLNAQPPFSNPGNC